MLPLSGRPERILPDYDADCGPTLMPCIYQNGPVLTIGHVTACYHAADYTSAVASLHDREHLKLTESVFERLQRACAPFLARITRSPILDPEGMPNERYQIYLWVRPFRLRPDALELELGGIHCAVANLDDLRPSDHKLHVVKAEVIPTFADPRLCERGWRLASRTGSGRQADQAQHPPGSTDSIFAPRDCATNLKGSRMAIKDFGWKFRPLDDWTSTLLGFTLVVKLELLKRGNDDFRTTRVLTVEVNFQGLSFTDAVQGKTAVSSPSVRSERDLRLVMSAEGDLYVKLEIESKNLLPRE